MWSELSYDEQRAIIAYIKQLSSLEDSPYKEGLSAAASELDMWSHLHPSETE